VKELPLSLFPFGMTHLASLLTLPNVPDVLLLHVRVMILLLNHLLRVHPVAVAAMHRVVRRILGGIIESFEGGGNVGRTACIGSRENSRKTGH
jgi:hypothetical protein